MKIGIADAGVYLAAMFPATLAARPVLIPWNEFTIVKQPFIGYSRYELTLAQLPEIHIILPEKVAEEISAYLKNKQNSFFDNSLTEGSQSCLDVFELTGENRKQDRLR
jgi:hypothetical protein